MRFLSPFVVVAALLVLPAPALAISVDTGPPPVTTATTGFTFGWTLDEMEAYDSYECLIDTTPEPCTSTTSHTYSGAALPEGNHTFTVTGSTGGVADTENAGEWLWTIDLTAPVVTISSGPSGTVNSSSATFAFAATDVSAVTFQCSLDGGAPAACTSGQSYTGLSNGNHTFSVTGTDGAGQTGSATRTWTVAADSTAPDTTITAAPEAVNNLSSPSVAFTSNEAGATFQCSVNGGEFVGCSSPHLVAALLDGAITFQVRAVDAAGNVDPTPAAAGWTRDTVAPAAPALAVGRRAGAAQNATGATAAFQTTTALRAVWNRVPDAASSQVEYRLTRASTDPEQGKWTPWQTGAATQADTTVGTGITGCFRARSVDAAGNASAWTVKCTTVPYKATSASVKSPFRKRRASAYFAGQYVRFAGSGQTRGYLRLQLSPRGQGAAVKRVSLLATKCRRCGAVRVVVTGDGTPPVGEDSILGDRTISLRSSRTQRTRLITAVIFDDAEPSTGKRYVYVFGVGKAADRRIEGVAVSAL